MLSDLEMLAMIISMGKILDAPRSRYFGLKHFEIIVGIGSDHTASITLDEDALHELSKLTGRDFTKV